MTHYRAATTLGLLVVATLVSFAAMSFESPAAVLLIGTCVVIAGVGIGLRRSATDRGRPDLFHPMVFPLAYIGCSFLAPAWWFMVGHGALLGFSAQDFGNQTALLMTLSVIGLFGGLSLTPYRSRTREQAPIALAPWVISLAGWTLLMIPLLVAAIGVAQGSVTTRGLAQLDYSVFDSIRSFSRMSGPAAVLFMVIGNQLRSRPLLNIMEWMGVAALAVATGLGGDRGAVVAVALTLLFCYTRSGTPVLRVMLALLGLFAFVTSVVTYRSTRIDGSYDSSSLKSILTDWSVATYTTGTVSAVVPDRVPFLHGSTYFAGLVRQLPSPVVNRFYGPPDDTGSFVFRSLADISNPNMGYGFSLPAEGWLNFGLLGLVAACFLFGAFIAWAYPRADWPPNRPINVLYPLIIAPLPMSVRADSLGLIKGTLYPFLFVVLVLMISTTVRRLQARPIEAYQVVPDGGRQSSSFHTVPTFRGLERGNGEALRLAQPMPRGTAEGTTPAASRIRTSPRVPRDGVQ